MGRVVSDRALCDAAGNELPGRMIDVCGCETYVVDAGDGPPVLLLHGYGDSVDGWRRLFPSLLKQNRVVAIDLPGFGRSQRPRKTALVDHYANFFPVLADTLGVERSSVIGHSLGGAVALTIALEQPQAVDRLVLIAPAGLGGAPPWWWHAIAGTYFNWQAMLLLPNPLAKSVIRSTLRTFLRQRLVYDDRQLEHLIEEFVERHGGRRQLIELIDSGRSLIGGYDGTLLKRAGEELEMPVSVIWGEHDRLAPVEHAGWFDETVSHADVRVLERCGHYPQMEFPSLFNRLVLDAVAPPNRPKPARRRRRSGALAAARRDFRDPKTATR